MRALLIHAKKFSYVPVQKEIEEAELAAKGQKISYGRCLVLFVSFEQGDGEGKAFSLVDLLAKDAAQVKESEFVVYPFVHLTEEPLEAGQAVKLLSLVAKALSEKGFKVHKAPFGWTKSFSIETMPHAIAERGIRLRAPVSWLSSSAIDPLIPW